MKQLTIKILTYKDYIRIFSISEKTAKTWIAEDRRKVGFKRITEYHVKELYGVSLG